MSETKAKSLNKRFFIAFIIFSIMLAITLQPKLTIEGLITKKLVLKESPVFMIKKPRKSASYPTILFSFNNFEEQLYISGLELQLADRAAIKSELKAGDSVEVKYDYTSIYQVSKNGKNYMMPEKSLSSGSEVGKVALWLWPLALLACVAGWFMVRFKVRFAGWIATGIILISAVVLILIFRPSFGTEPYKYEEPEFSEGTPGAL